MNIKRNTFINYHCRTCHHRHHLVAFLIATMPFTRLGKNQGCRELNARKIGEFEQIDVAGVQQNGPFLSCFEPHYESEAKCKAFHLKISFICI